MELEELVRILVVLGETMTGSHAERVCLVSLYASGDASMTTLAGRIGMSRGAMTSIIDRLEDQGLVERFLSKEDRRIISVRATDLGGQVVFAAENLIIAERKDIVAS